MNLLANLDCGVTEEQINEAVCTMEKIKQLSENSEDVLLVDVRTPQEYGNGHVYGSINIPLGDEAQYLDKFKPMKGLSLLMLWQTGTLRNQFPQQQRLGKHYLCQLPVWCIGIRPVIQ